jgi:hypothetical protein
MATKQSEAMLRELLEVCQKWVDKGVSQSALAEVCLYIAAIESLNANLPEAVIHQKINAMIRAFCRSFVDSGDAVSHLPPGEA